MIRQQRPKSSARSKSATPFMSEPWRSTNKMHYCARLRWLQHELHRLTTQVRQQPANRRSGTMEMPLLETVLTACSCLACHRRSRFLFFHFTFCQDHFHSLRFPVSLLYSFRIGFLAFLSSTLTVSMPCRRADQGRPSKSGFSTRQLTQASRIKALVHTSPVITPAPSRPRPPLQRRLSTQSASAPACRRRGRWWAA